MKLFAKSLLLTMIFILWFLATLDAYYIITEEKTLLEALRSEIPIEFR